MDNKKLNLAENIFDYDFNCTDLSHPVTDVKIVTLAQEFIFKYGKREVKQGVLF